MTAQDEFGGFPKMSERQKPGVRMFTMTAIAAGLLFAGPGPHGGNSLLAQTPPQVSESQQDAQQEKADRDQEKRDREQEARDREQEKQDAEQERRDHMQELYDDGR